MTRRIDNFSINELRLNQYNKQHKVNNNSTAFNDLLNRSIEQKTSKGIKFSKHATERLNQRGITLNNEDIKQVESAITMADEKGINNSLIVTDKAVYIANIKSRTVVTAMESMKGRVFTNVDGVVNI